MQARSSRSASRNLQPCQCSSTRPSVTWPAGTFGSISLGTNSPPTILLVEIRILFFVNAATQDVFSTATATVEIACCVIPASSTPGGGPGRADEGLQTYIAETLEVGAVLEGRAEERAAERQESVSRALAREVGVLWSSSRCDRPRTLRVWVGGWGEDLPPLPVPASARRQR